MKHSHFVLQRELASLKRIGHLLVKYRECWNSLTEAWGVSSAREANCEILILRINVDVSVSEQVLIEPIAKLNVLPGRKAVCKYVLKYPKLDQ